MAYKSPAKDKLEAIGIDAICERIGEGATLRNIATGADVGLGSVMRYCEQPEHVERYARAMAVRADMMAAEILEIADNGANDTYIDENGNKRTDQDVIARSRLRVDARKWLAAKMAPKKYGDKIDVDTKLSGAVTIETIKREIIRPK